VDTTFNRRLHFLTPEARRREIASRIDLEEAEDLHGAFTDGRLASIFEVSPSTIIADRKLLGIPSSVARRERREQELQEKEDAAEAKKARLRLGSKDLTSVEAVESIRSLIDNEAVPGLWGDSNLADYFHVSPTRIAQLRDRAGRLSAPKRRQAAKAKKLGGRS